MKRLQREDKKGNSEWRVVNNKTSLPSIFFKITPPNSSHNHHSLFPSPASSASTDEKYPPLQPTLLFFKCIIKRKLIYRQVIIYFRLLNVFVINYFNIYQIIDLYAPGKGVAMVKAICIDARQYLH